MGQATAELPDPMQAPPLSAANTDDLLAQLAGEEIDRLLAEADPGTPTALPANGAEPNTVSVLPGASSKPADLTGAALAAPSDPSAGTSAPAAAPATPTVSAELDDLFAQLDVSAPPAVGSNEPLAVTAAVNAPADPGPVPNAPAAARAEAPERQDSQANALAAEIDEDAKLSAGRGGLAGGVAAVAKADLAEAPSIHPAGVALPIYLRPLEWINAPMASCPDQVRDTVGKIAILTAVNALSVLAYVLLFRGH